jgi:hypothetical protein
MVDKTREITEFQKGKGRQNKKEAEQRAAERKETD